MLKIYKCLKLRKTPPPLTVSLRNYAKKKRAMFECKQPVDDDAEFYENLEKKFREAHKPAVFKCKPHSDPRIYKNIFLFACLPVIAIAITYEFFLKKEEPKRLKFVPFEHLRIRKKPFAWHPERSLFHNPKYNALPSGYEVEVPEDEEIDPFDLLPEK